MKDSSLIRLKRLRTRIILFLFDAVVIAGSFFAALWLMHEFNLD